MRVKLYSHLHLNPFILVNYQEANSFLLVTSDPIGKIYDIYDLHITFVDILHSNQALEFFFF